MKDARRKAFRFAFERHFIEMLKLIDSVTLIFIDSTIRRLKSLATVFVSSMLHENDDSDIR